MIFMAIVESDLSLISKVQGLCRELGIEKVHIARRKDEAVQHLEGVGVYSDRARFPYPSIVLLDTESPHAEDLQFLAWLRSHGSKELPLVLLTDVRTRDLKKVHCFLDEWTVILPRQPLEDLASFLLQMEVGAFS